MKVGDRVVAISDGGFLGQSVVGKCGTVQTINDREYWVKFDGLNDPLLMWRYELDYEKQHYLNEFAKHISSR